jgi:CMP-N-acetylneuraminic acid synthetase
MKILTIIPARGGSKGIPRKNITDLCGEPLIAYTIKASLGSKYLDKVIVSTDDQEIADIARAHGADVPFTRPPEASHDTATALNVIAHALTWLKENQSYAPDAVIYLQPTSPLRTTRHINEAIELFLSHADADSLVSVIVPPHNCHPHKLIKRSGEYVVPYLDSEPQKFDRHNLPEILARNGPAILIGKTDVFLQNKLYGEKILPYIMDSHESLDIDEPIDMELAEFYLSRKTKL